MATETYGQKLRNTVKSVFSSGTPHNYKVESTYGGMMPNFMKRNLKPKDFQEIVENHASYSAPLAKGKLSENSQTQSLPFFGPIGQSYDKTNSTVTNQTQPDHLLHSGKVQQQWDFPNFKRTTIGTGDGILPALNEKTSGLLWGPQPALRAHLYARAARNTFTNWMNPEDDNDK